MNWIKRAALPAAAIALALCSTVDPASANAASAAPRSASSALQQARAAEAAVLEARFGIPSATSPNWSGYVDTNYKSDGTFTGVSATWHVPAVESGTCSDGTFATGTGLAGFWVGLDGWGGSTVEQTGTSTECYKGNAYYWSWAEMAPQPPVVLESINPGDVMSGSVGYDGGDYTLILRDLTSGASDSEIVTCPSGSTCSNHSAEVVAESPAGCVTSSGETCRKTPFGTYYLMPEWRWVNFSAISVSTQHSRGFIDDFGPNDVTMLNSANITLAKVSTTLTGHNAFTDSWGASG
jgi:hypothetical protein